MPPSARSSFSRSRTSLSISFFVNSVLDAGLGELLELASRLIDWRIVLKFVSMPPSQRWLTYGMPQRCASVAIASRAARLLPTNSSVPPSATSLRTNSVASLVQRQRLLEIDDVDLVALSEDELRHLRVPEAGLVPKMHARFQHPAHRHVGHGTSPLGLVLHAAPLTTPFPEHPVSGLTARVWCLTSKLRCL